MADYEGRYEGNGYGDSKSQYDMEYDRESSRSRDKEKVKEREKDRARSKDRDRDRERDRDRARSKDRDRDRDRARSKDHDRDRDRDRARSKDRDRDRDRDRDMDRHGDHRDRGDRREHRRDRSDDNERHRSRDSDRHRDSESERGQHRHRSRSHSRSMSKGRSRSRSRSRSKSKRMSGFDMAPPVTAMVPGVTAAAQMPGVAATIPGMFPNLMLPIQFPAISVPVQSMTQQATRHARRVYVGGLSPTANEQSVATFFNQVMAVIGGNTAGPGDAVVNVYINHDKKFAFVEMRSVEEASNAMALDGIIFEGAPVKVRRPSDYNPSLAAALGPSQPNPNLNLGSVGLSPGSAGALEGPDRIFVGGLPYYFTEAQIRELLESFGPLRGFNLVKDRETGNSKGYAFCVYQDPGVTDIACAALNGIKMGDKTLTVRRAIQGAAQPGPEQENVLLQAQQQLALQFGEWLSTPDVLEGYFGYMHIWLWPICSLFYSYLCISKLFMHCLHLVWNFLTWYIFIFVQKQLILNPVTLPTKVVCLTQVVSADELKDDEEYEDIMEDMKTEGGKYGNLLNVVIPRPNPNGDPIPGVGKVFLEYADLDSSAKARASLHGRKFGGNQVVAVYYPTNKFSQGDYE